MPDRLQGLFLREERPNAPETLRQRAESNLEKLRKLVPGCGVESIDILDVDKAVIGPRAAVKILSATDFSAATDIVVDLSALSVGIFFPMIRFLVESKSTSNKNIHLVVAHHPGVDAGIVGVPGDRVETMVGFRGAVSLDESAGAAKLWLPLLSKGRKSVLERIQMSLRPDDVCPILPFPALDPHVADELIEHYADEFETVWAVNPQSIVYAHEGNPLDLYRSILRIDDFRQRVFEELGGSVVALSPIGSKVLSIGALMAALERPFPVLYIESIGYEVDFSRLDALGSPEILHVWLHGEAYTSVGRAA